MFVLQSIRKPVLDEDASMGECLADGCHLLVHVTSLPYPLCGTTASKFTSLVPTNALKEKSAKNNLLAVKIIFFQCLFKTPPLVGDSNVGVLFHRLSSRSRL